MVAGGNTQECFEGARKQLNDHLDGAATVVCSETLLSVCASLRTSRFMAALAHTNKEKSKIFQRWSSNRSLKRMLVSVVAYPRNQPRMIKSPPLAGFFI